MNGPLVIQKDNVDQLPPYSSLKETAPWGSPAHRPRLDWRVVAVLCVFLLIAGWLVSRDVRDWLAYGWGAELIRVAVWSAVIIAILFGLKRLLLIEQPGGFRLFAWQVGKARGDQVLAGALAVQHAYADNQTRNMAALTLTNSTPAPLLTQAEEIIEVGPDVGPLTRDQWLLWLDMQPHALFAAKTGKGKSTTAKAGLKPRIAAGEQAFIIDPHANDWWLPSVGGGENWQEVREAIHAVHALYKERLEYRAQYKRETGRELDQYHFPRLTVVLDEANATRLAFERLYGASRKQLNPWQLIMEVLGSGARKVGISIWPLAQSALVEDLGLSGAMRQNFTRFALDDYTIRQMVDREERSPDRKKAIYAALAKQQYPATAIVDAEVYLLDRTGLDQISPPSHIEHAAWDGWPPKAEAPQPFPAWCQSVAARAYYLGKTTDMTTREIRDAVRGDQNIVIKAVAAARNGAINASRQST